VREEQVADPVDFFVKKLPYNLSSLELRVCTCTQKSGCILHTHICGRLQHVRWLANPEIGGESLIPASVAVALQSL
jgi:hypothetical protein